MIITIAGEDYKVHYTEDADLITDRIRLDKPKFITYDVESTGLHIKKDRPFLGAVCFNHVVYVFPTTPENVRCLRMWNELVRRIYGHNVTFDMHMSANMVGEELISKLNWGDTMGICRLTFEAVSTRDGGDKLGLKPVSKKYIDPDADRFEKEVKAWLKAKEAKDKKILTALLKPLKWSASRFEKALKADEEIPDEIIEIYREWRKLYSKPNYQDVPMDIMLPYVATDVILTKLLVEKGLPVIVHREQVSTMNREFRLLRTVFKMERQGIPVDRPYLEESNTKLGEYIDRLYERLYEIAGMKFSVNQHKVVKQIYTDILGEEPPSTDKKFLKKMEAKGDEMAGIITRLRRLEKWKSTYVEKILRDSSYDGVFYTQLNQFNPVSGRFSGDAQQMPKDAILTEEGYQYEKETGKKAPSEFVLYHPRKAFVGHMYYLDYSQVELRMQGHYTLYFGGDTNLCRAYMPYRCKHYNSGKEFSFETFEARKEWIDLRPGAPTDLHWEDALKEGWSVWVNPDTNSPWIPTDVHSSTTEKALIIMGYDLSQMDEKEFKWWRNKGKTFNFMRNYGGGDAMAAETLEIKFEQAQAMNRGYTEAFPVVVTYQNGVVQEMRMKGYCVNMLGRRYYVSNWNKHYKVANYLIQGSCADYLKEKMIEIDDYLEEHNLWDKLAMSLCVHDELQFKNLLGDDSLDVHIARIKEIMEDIPDVNVPIVAEMEVTKTDWSEKKKFVPVAA